MTLQEQVDFFLKNGYLIIPQLISKEELEPLREQSLKLMESAPNPGEENDYQYGAPGEDGKPKVRRIEYMLGKGDPFLRLLAHPRILELVTAILGQHIVCSWDSMVIKVPYQGAEVKWHRDVPNYHRLPVFNTDFYLDDATPDTCLRVIPGTQSGPDQDMSGRNARHEFDFEGTTQAAMKAGDVMLHDVMVYHGSPENHGPDLRRVIYYEWRALDTLLDTQAYPNDWVQERVKLLQKAVALRNQSGLDDSPVSLSLREGWGAPEEEFMRVPTRIPHPGWDEPVGAR